MTHTAMADLSERARRVLEGNKPALTFENCHWCRGRGRTKGLMYGWNHCDKCAGQGGRYHQSASTESADLIRELLEENERLRTRVEKLIRACSMAQDYLNDCRQFSRVEQIASLVGDMDPPEHNTRDAGPIKAAKQGGSPCE